MTGLSCNRKDDKKDAKDDLEYMNVDQIEPSDQRDLDEDAAAFLRFDDLQEDAGKEKE